MTLTPAVGIVGAVYRNRLPIDHQAANSVCIKVRMFSIHQRGCNTVGRTALAAMNPRAAAVFQLIKSMHEHAGFRQVI